MTLQEKKWIIDGLYSLLRHIQDPNMLYEFSDAGHEKEIWGLYNRLLKEIYEENELIGSSHCKGKWDASFEHCIEGTFQEGDFVFVYKVSETNYRPNGKIETMKLKTGDIYYYSCEDWYPIENKYNGTFQYNGR